MAHDLEQRIEDLEIRLMHLEAGQEEMTRTLLLQEQQTTRQAEMIRQLENQLKGLSTLLAPAADLEPPPPHY